MASVDTTRVIAAVIGLAGFTVALVAGLAADNPFEVCVSRAILALAACSIVGLVLGWVMRTATLPGQAPTARPATPARAAAQTGT